MPLAKLLIKLKLKHFIVLAEVMEKMKVMEMTEVMEVMAVIELMVDQFKSLP